MLHKASPLKYWSYAFLAAAYLINRLPTPILKHQSPFESLFQHMPNYDKLRAFGCLCFPWMHLSSNRVYISRHVQFIEHKFPFASNTTPLDLDQAISTWSSCSPLFAIQPSFCGSHFLQIFPHQAPSCTNTGLIGLISSLSPTSSSPPTTTSAPLSACDAPPSATYLCVNPLFHNRMKHVTLDYHFVREKVVDDSLKVSHVNTQSQLADVLTKPLSKSRFLFLIQDWHFEMELPSCGRIEAHS
ncbi:hypothetical protein AAG906_037359 [Vitis piasezkii]